MGRLRASALAFILVSALWVSMIPRVSAADQIPSWATPVNISYTSSNVFTATVDRGLAVDPQGNIHVVYYGSQEIFYVNNMRGYWSAPYNVTQNDVLDQYSTIAVDTEGNIHLAYSGYDSHDMEIFYVNKTNRGWSIPVNLSKNANIDRVVSIGVDSNGSVHVAWYGRDGSSLNDYEIFYTNNAQGYWISPLNITKDNLAYALNPSLAIDSQDKIHIVWEGRDDSAFYDYEIFYANNLGESWVVANVTQNEVYDNSPSIGLGSNGIVHLAYQQYVSIGEDIGVSGIFYISKSGTGWTTPVNLSATGSLIAYLSLAVDRDDNIHLAFSQIENSDFEIFYTNRVSGNWSSLVNITQNDLDEIAPNLVVDEHGDAHIIYYKDVPYDHNVLYVRTVEPYEFPLLIVWIGIPVIGITLGAIILLLRRRH